MDRKEGKGDRKRVNGNRKRGKEDRKRGKEDREGIEDSKRSEGQKAYVFRELTLRPVGSGTVVSGTADSDTCSPVVPCTRSSDQCPPHYPPRPSDCETCVASLAVILALPRPPGLVLEF